MIKIELDDKLLQKALSQILSNAQNTKPLMRAIAGELISQTDQNFRSGMGADGQAFAPLAASTLLARARKGQSGQILQVSGLLAKSPMSTVTNTSAQVSSNRKQSRILHLGGKAGRNRSVTIVARPYLPAYKGKLQKGLEPVILDLALTHLAKGV